ncbi:helix-turn-helix domain-containing protein [Globicatella sulfidifaciens]
MNANEIGNRIKKLRISKGKTQKDLGELLDLSDTAVRNWENGRNYPGPERIKDLSNILGVSTNYIMFGDSKTYINSILKKNNLPFDDEFIQYMDAINDLVDEVLMLSEAEVLDYYNRYYEGNEYKLDELNLGAHLYLAASEVDNENINAASKYYKQRFNKSTEEAYNELNDK